MSTSTLSNEQQISFDLSDLTILTSIQLSSIIYHPQRTPEIISQARNEILKRRKEAELLKVEEVRLKELKDNLVRIMNEFDQEENSFTLFYDEKRDIPSYFFDNTPTDRTTESILSLSNWTQSPATSIDSIEKNKYLMNVLEGSPKSEDEDVETIDSKALKRLRDDSFDFSTSNTTEDSLLSIQELQEVKPRVFRPTVSIRPSPPLNLTSLNLSQSQPTSQASIEIPTAPKAFIRNFIGVPTAPSSHSLPATERTFTSRDLWKLNEADYDLYLLPRNSMNYVNPIFSFSYNMSLLSFLNFCLPAHIYSTAHLSSIIFQKSKFSRVVESMIDRSPNLKLIGSKLGRVDKGSFNLPSGKELRKWMSMRTVIEWIWSVKVDWEEVAWVVFESPLAIYGIVKQFGDTLKHSDVISTAFCQLLAHLEKLEKTHLLSKHMNIALNLLKTFNKIGKEEKVEWFCEPDGKIKKAPWIEWFEKG